VKRLLLGLCALAALACIKSPSGVGVPPGSGPLIVVYKASLGEGQGARRGAKIALWAERPDRLHAELIAPVGGVAYILDAGGGNVCVVDVGEAVAYVGEDGPDAIAALTGVRISVADAVAALLDGASSEGITVSRLGGANGTLPDTLRIESGGRALAIERVRVARGATDAAALGTGRPPERLRLRPLADFVPDEAGEPALSGAGR
jgi:hypothetical protein